MVHLTFIQFLSIFLLVAGAIIAIIDKVTEPGIYNDPTSLKWRVHEYTGPLVMVFGIGWIITLFFI